MIGSRVVLGWMFFGISLGYFVFHPLVMIAGHLMRNEGFLHSHSFSDIIVSDFLRSFSLEMLPWALGFGILGALIGLAHGKKEQARRGLSREKAFSEDLFESSQCGMVLLSGNKEIVKVNSAALKALGRTREEILGKVCHTIICPAQEGECPIMDLGEQVDKSEKTVINKEGKEVPIIRTVSKIEKDGETYLLETFVDITERKKAEGQKERLISELQSALANVRTLSGLLPICAHCKKIRDDKGYWNQIESYIRDHSEAQFSHGICPDCAKKFYPELYEDGK